jgi:hypothetical protein
MLPNEQTFSPSERPLMPRVAMWPSGGPQAFHNSSFHEI